MAQVSNLYRRSSGIYAVRLVVPQRLRSAVGKGELHLSTQTRILAVAKAVAASLLAHWREKFFLLERLSSMNLQQVSTGSPSLVSGGYLRLAEAAAASGFDEDELLREAAQDRLSLHIRASGLDGHVVPWDSLEFEPESGTYVVPSASRMPAMARQITATGLLNIRHGSDLASTLLNRPSADRVAFGLPSQDDVAFVPDVPVRVTRSMIEVPAASVERLRIVARSRVTPEQLAAQPISQGVKHSSSKAKRHVSEAIDAFMQDRSLGISGEQARRVREACALFAHLTGDPQLQNVDRDSLRRFESVLLPQVPANENKVRLQFGSRTVSESIVKVAGTNWPRISEAECSKRMKWIGSMFAWLTREKWISDDPAVGLGGTTKKRTKRADESRRSFTTEELRQIFGAEWFITGRGALTAKGTYREFLPFYYCHPQFRGQKIYHLSACFGKLLLK